jgi:pyrophosphatase PpaX
VILSIDETIVTKPDPKVVEMALEKIGGDKDKALIIGDSEKDIVTARNAGIDSVLYYPKANEVFYEKENLTKLNPTYTISSHAELLRFV